LAFAECTCKVRAALNSVVQALPTLLYVLQGEAAKHAETAAGGDGEALANGALWVYSIAFDEFRRALATESRDRAELLAAMWDHCFALVQVREYLLRAVGMSRSSGLWCDHFIHRIVTSFYWMQFESRYNFGACA
jgi:hypothetical protein